MARLWQDESGASLVEYGLLIALIAVVALLAVEFVGDEHTSMWSEIASNVTNT